MPAPASKARTNSPRLVVLVLCLCGTIVALQQTLVVPLLPDYPKILNTTPENASWLVTAALLTAAVATPIITRAADMYGKRKMLLVCLIAMATGSVIGALSTSLALVLVARSLQGFAAALVPVGISIMRDELPSERVGGAVALMSATLGIGAAIGTPVAGVIYAQWSWHALFWVSAAAAGIFVVVVPLVMAESPLRSPGRFDIPGALMLSAAMVALLLALSKGAHWGWTSKPVLALVLLGAVLLAVWTPYELRVSAPMVDLRTSARRPVLLTNLAAVFVGFAMFANLLASTQQLQMPTATGYGFGLDVKTAGLALLPAGLSMVIFAPVSDRLSKAFGARVTLIVGSLVMAVGYVVRVFFTTAVLHVIVGSAIITIGTALTFAAMPTLIMRSVPITETASANGLNTLLRSVGTALSSAGLAAIFASSTMQVGDVALPTLSAFTTTFWIAGAAAVVAAFISAFLPSRRLGTPITSAVEAAAVRDELTVSGTVRDGDGQPVRQAVVSVLSLAGEQVDWGRADNDGNFRVAVPEVDEYVVVGVGDGWAPQPQLLRLSPDVPLACELAQRLRLVGHVASGDKHEPGALVALTARGGELVASATTDERGRYWFELPPAGRYVLTSVSADRQRFASRHVSLVGQPRVFNIDLTASGDASQVDAITGAHVASTEFPSQRP